MVEHVNKNAWRDQEHITVEPMFLTSQPGKQHCKDIYINELLL
jgi:hypothetical protein